MDNADKKIALVTGASSGIGRATAQAMAEEGYAVFGTSRYARFETIGEKGVSYMMLPMTLEDEGSVQKAVEYIINKRGRIDVVVNAAGSGLAGAIEETSAAEARRQFDICFFGVISVLNCVLPYMRSAGSGVVVNIGSMAACFPIAFQGMYSAAKSALFMMTAVLRMEVKPFGIKACVIEPGDTRTGFTEKRMFAEKTKHTAYRKPFERSMYEMIRSELSAKGPEKCAKLVLMAAKMKDPPVRISVGLENKVLYALSKITSWRLKIKVLEMMYLKKDPPKDAVWTFEKHFKVK